MDNKLRAIEEALSQRHRSKSEILENQINIRLIKSLNTYLSEIDNNVKYINQKDELKVLKKL